MAQEEIVKEYAKGDFHIIWKPRKCIHSGVCVKSLPEVYLPDSKPWIRPENASVEALRTQILKCPSGALTFREEGPAGGNTKAHGLQARLVPGGPLMVKGDISLELDGKVQHLEGNTAFCRCGASSRKPFCDGSHKEVDFDS